MMQPFNIGAFGAMWTMVNLVGGFNPFAKILVKIGIFPK